MIAPLKLHFLSDYSTAELVGKVKGKDDVFEYKYTRCFEPNDKPFEMDLKRIQYLVSVKLMKIE